MDVIERHLPAMGSLAQIVVVGGPSDLADHAIDRLSQLEARWSRFLPDSEVSRYNASGLAGEELDLSPDTRLLLDRAAEGYRVTAGRFDPYRLGDVVAAGYGASLDRYAVTTAAAPPPTSGFDPGGIGKGLAADILTAEIMGDGAAGALVSIGGDLRVRGVNPDGESWRIDIEDPRDGGIVDTVTLADGAVATSSQRKRRLTSADGSDGHHLIDPHTGTPSASPVLAATVISAEGWQAEVLAKVAFLDAFGDAALTSDAGFELVESLGAAALVVTGDLVATTSRWNRFALTKAGTT